MVDLFRQCICINKTPLKLKIGLSLGDGPQNTKKSPISTLVDFRQQLIFLRIYWRIEPGMMVYLFRLRICIIKTPSKLKIGFSLGDRRQITKKSLISTLVDFRQ